MAIKRVVTNKPVSKTFVRGMFYDNLPRMRKDILILLRKEMCNVHFLKADGTKRKMLASLAETFLPPKKDQASDREQNAETLVVWDIEAGEWRSFRLDRFLRCEVA